MELCLLLQTDNRVRSWAADDDYNHDCSYNYDNDNDYDESNSPDRCGQRKLWAFAGVRGAFCN